MRLFAVIDTNVLVSSLLSANEEAATVLLVSRMLTGDVVPVHSPQTLAEYREVLARRKFGFDHETVDYLLAAIEHFGLAVRPEPSEANLPDEKDIPFLEAALAAPGAYLVTGNMRHFPGVPIAMTLREMIDIMDGGGQGRT